MLQNIRLLIEYDGTPYSGWQMQKTLPSVQGELTTALRRLTGEPQLSLSCAGRTDAGVHAYGQVANFHTHYRLEARRYATALNRFLPPSIRIHTAVAVPDAFDARFSAASKRYRYRLYEGLNPLALDCHRAWHVRRSLNLQRLQAAAQQLVGEHDFNAFRSSHCDAEHAVRRIHSVEVAQMPRPPIGRFVDITFHANAFCRHMCRILAGTLMEIAAGSRPPGGVLEALQQRQRQAAGVTAPPWGLTLLEVLYAPDATQLQAKQA
jgi:tRNA pseudouridine38-40 synthase